MAYYDPGELAESNIREIAEVIPELVAKHLSVPGTDGELTPNDVEVRVCPSNSLDVNTKDLEIIIFAGLYLERLANLDERRSVFTEDLREVMRIVFEKEVGVHVDVASWTGFVWIILSPGSFEEF